MAKCSANNKGLVWDLKGALHNSNDSLQQSC